MATPTFEIESSEVEKIKAVLKALGGKRIKVESEEVSYSTLEEKVKEAREEKRRGELVTLDTKKIWGSI